jgi:CRISPR type IV-associated protein Csf1
MQNDKSRGASITLVPAAFAIKEGGEILTPTQIVYNAWLNTPKPIVYHTSDGKGAAIDTICEFCDPIRHEHFDTGWAGRCLICGSESQGGILSKRLLKESYTDWSCHKAPGSDHICAACAFTMLLNIDSRRCALFRYSFVADAQLHICNRAELRDHLISPPEPPFVMVCAVSQKKHLAIKSLVSYSRDSFFCMFEEERVQVNRTEAERDILLCEALRGLGFTKDEIERGRIRYDKIKEFGISAADKISAAIEERAGTRQFALCLHVAQKMNEEDAICYLGLTRRTNTSPPEHCSSMPYTAAGIQDEDRAVTTCGSRSSALSDGRQNEQMTLEGF